MEGCCLSSDCPTQHFCSGAKLGCTGQSSLGGTSLRGTCVPTKPCKDFNQDDTQELCQAREAGALTLLARHFFKEGKYCCKDGNGNFETKDKKCDGGDIKREDCDSDCRDKCEMYKTFPEDPKPHGVPDFWEIVGPMREMEKHIGTAENLGVAGKPFAISARVGSTMFVSFKGADSGPEDWVTNIDFSAEEFTTQEWNLGGTRPHLYAHKGFIEYYDGIKRPIFDHVDKMMKKSRASEIHVSGHSLGGALANLGAVDLAAKYPNVKVALWSFAAPRVFRGATDKGYFDEGRDSAMNGG